jgi:hypothetical protein
MRTTMMRITLRMMKLKGIERGNRTFQLRRLFLSTEAGQKRWVAVLCRREALGEPVQSCGDAAADRPKPSGQCRRSSLGFAVCCVAGRTSGRRPPEKSSCGTDVPMG